MEVTSSLNDNCAFKALGILNATVRRPLYVGKMFSWTQSLRNVDNRNEFIFKCIVTS